MILLYENLLLLGQVIPQVTFVARAAGRELPLLHPERGAWKLLNGPRLILLELPPVCTFSWCPLRRNEPKDWLGLV